MKDISPLERQFLDENHFGNTANESASMAIFEFEFLLNKLALLNGIFEDEKSPGKERIERMLTAMRGVNK